MTRRTIVSTNAYTQDVVGFIASRIPAGFEFIPAGHLDQTEFIQAIERADYLLVGGRRMLGQRVLSGAKHLKMIQRTGVGLDSLDIPYLQERGIPLYVNRGVNAQSVAEHAVMLMLACLRDVVSNTMELRTGTWIKQSRGLHNRELGSMTVGIVGLGQIGQRVCKMVRSFGATVVYYDERRRDKEEELALDVEYLPFEELLFKAQVISLHCPLTRANRHLFDDSAFSAIQPGSYFINTARGGLVDEPALIEALRTGRIAAAGLDVYEDEPLSTESALLELPNVILTSHVAGITLESFGQMIDEALRNIVCFEAKDFSHIEQNRLV